ncbi:ejaculatory bulb-specific protein 1 isoform X2 [Drosophila erecta]|uniref:ejaculatory bulb-specific protein 1 isoform X2 n=1 Tax=Drosophila erecta TaxID=7220 RepID=UPI000F04FFC9|nr:ejaculatory bulb-specific protein 1 isoform X2 [Drosophila erecta]
MVRQLILVLFLSLFCGSSHAVVSELARQAESVIQGLADIKMAPLRYLDVLFGANPGGVRGLDDRNPAAEASLAAAATLEAAKVANILAKGKIFAGGDISVPGYSKISAGVGKGSDLITIIKNTRSYDPYLIPPGLPGYNYPVGWPIHYPLGPSWPNRPPWQPNNPLSPDGPHPSLDGLPPGGNFPGGPPPSTDGLPPGGPPPSLGGPPFLPGGPPSLPGGPPSSPGGPPSSPGGPPSSPGGPPSSPGGPPSSPGGPPSSPGGPPSSPGGQHRPFPLPWIIRGLLPGGPPSSPGGQHRPVPLPWILRGLWPRPVGVKVGASGSVNVDGGIFGNGGLFGTGIFGQNGLFGTGILSGPSLDPFGIFTPIGNFFGSLGNLFGFSPPSQVIPIFGGRYGPYGRGLQGSITLDVGGIVPSPKRILKGLLHPLFGFLG